jgi:alkanesulfonate monooxygenase SsuD/methylene tetrahydromethanopterin reductase-like flavin-dependent oxidoreductase (luciferase family)
MIRPQLLIGLVSNAADPSGITERVQWAERHGLSFALFDDGLGAPGRTTPQRDLDPIEAASFASANTQAIGLIATAAATHAEPYHLSNRFSSLDWGSSGRAGWLVTVDASAARARAYSTTAPTPDVAGREADAVVDAVRRLWDSWEDGALIADTASGRFLDAEKIHYIDVREEFFSIRGPALMPRPKQGQVVVLARAGDPIARPDVTLVTGATSTDVVDAAVRARAAGAPRVFAEISLRPDDDLLALLRGLAEHLDGVVLDPGETGVGLDELARTVTPALIADGLLVPPRPGQTLREQLELDRPASRYAVSKGL